VVCIALSHLFADLMAFSCSISGKAVCFLQTLHNWGLFTFMYYFIMTKHLFYNVRVRLGCF